MSTRPPSRTATPAGPTTRCRCGPTPPTPRSTRTSGPAVHEFGELQPKGEVMTRIRVLAVLAAALSMSLSLAAADAAMARGTITYDGHTMTFHGDAGGDIVSVGPSQGELA